MCKLEFIRTYAEQIYKVARVYMDQGEKTQGNTIIIGEIFFSVLTLSNDVPVGENLAAHDFIDLV